MSVRVSSEIEEVQVGRQDIMQGRQTDRENESRMGENISRDEGEEDEDEDEDDDDDDDDGVGDYMTAEVADEMYLYGDDGDGGWEGEAIGQCVDEFRIDHSTGSRKLKPEKFISRTNASDFDGAEALKMLQLRYTINYGGRKSGSRPAKEDDGYYPVFHLDMISVVGRPLRAITNEGGFFDNVTFTLQKWQAPYNSKHVITSLPFELTNRTFRLAVGASREVWFIVMHPIEAEVVEGGGRRQHQQQQQQKGKKNMDWAHKQGSALQRHHAEALAMYIKDIFLDGELIGEGVEALWKLNGSQSQTLTWSKWTTFQRLFMEGWVAFRDQQIHDEFWVQHEPAFHAYDHGANIEIKVNERFVELGRETRIRTASEDEASDSDSDGDVQSRQGDIEIEPALFVDEESQGYVVYGNREESEASGGSDDDEDDNASGIRDEGNGGGGSGVEEPVEEPMEVGEEENDDVEGQWNLYSDGLEQLRAELEQRYKLDHIDQVSYALAADINCIRGGEGEEEETVCLLADHCRVAEQYHATREFTFYPLGFHRRYGNFSSARPPRFLNDICTVMQNNMSYQNDEAHVLSFGFFQAYSNIKRAIRNRPEELLATQGIATAALGLPPSEANLGGPRLRGKQQKLLSRLQGELTPEQPASSTPFARERERMEAAVAQEQFAYRMEQVVTVKASKLKPRLRRFSSILQPIFQLMRFFVKDIAQYTPILRSFQPSVFPTVLCSYARLFEVALAEMHRRFRASGDKGLDLALSEGTAVLDRLGNYCFTGDPRVLMGTVLGPLVTLESIKKGAWPFISPDMLRFGDSHGTMNTVRWPRTSDNRPILLHVAALAFHYGSVTASNRHSQLWFSQLGGKGIHDIGTAVRFLEDVFRNLWIPQMIIFMTYQLRRQLQQGIRKGRRTVEHTQDADQFAEVLKAWEICDEPFSNKLSLLLFQHILKEGGQIWANVLFNRQLMMLFPSLRPPPKSKSTSTPNRSSSKPTPKSIARKARYDFAQQIYNTCCNSKLSAGRALSSAHATWFTVLRSAIRHTDEGAVSRNDWVGGMITAMANAGIEWIPGSRGQRLTSQHLIQLVGEVKQQYVLTGPPGSLKRAAMEAELRMELGEQQPKKARRGTIDFGCDIPFTRVPKPILTGFKKLDDEFKRRQEQGVINHYQVAHNCLVQSLGNPLCDLMMMLALTLAASTETPCVPSKTREFNVLPKRKDADMFVAALVTRMLWFFRPTAFPWAQDDRGILCVKEMTKKIEHKGTNNRVLRELGWIRVTSNRDSPYNSESKLAPEEDLYRLRKSLLSSRKKPEAFLSKVFHSSDSIWVERCDSIISDRGQGLFSN